MARVIVLIILALLPSAAVAQDVDIQVRIAIVGPVKDFILRATADVPVGRNPKPGQPGILPHWVSNHDLPYTPPKWLCVTDVYTHVYGANGNDMGGQVFVTWLHLRDGHDYHGWTTPPSVSRATPMAFPPGEEIALKVGSKRSELRQIRAHLSGYLGRDATETRREWGCRS